MVQEKKDRLSRIVLYLQIAFFIAVSGGTIFNSCQLKKQSALNERQWNSTYYPVAGIVGFHTMRYYINPKEKDTYENIAAVTLEFKIKNTGNVPVKDFKFDVSTKIGNTTLPFEEYPDMKKGVRLMQSMEISNSLTLLKEHLDRMLKNKERCITTYEFSYSDWRGYKKDRYKYAMEIRIVNKSPLLFTVIPMSTEEN